MKFRKKITKKLRKFLGNVTLLGKVYRKSVEFQN